MRLRLSGILLLSPLILGGCTASATKAVMDGDQSQVQVRSYQTRAFDTTDKQKTLRTIISTMQDLGFVIDKADATLGTVTGTKLDKYNLRLTVTVRPRGTTQMLVRANAQYNIQPVEDPKAYQDFFTALEKSMFLTAQQVD